MGKKKNKKVQKVAALNLEHFPTRERFARGDITIRSNIAQAEEPLRIDKLLAGGVIDEMQHLYGLQIITLWTITTRPMLRATRYDPSMGRGGRFDSTRLAVGKMSAEDQFYKTMSLLRPRAHDLIVKICFEEQGAIAAGRALGLPVNGITSYVREAFDALGNALSEMRRYKKDVVEKQPELQ